MSQLKNLAMAAAITSTNNIREEKGFLGLTTRLTYVPTRSRLDIVTKEYSADQGERLRRLLALDSRQLQSLEVDSQVPVSTAVGPVLLEALVARDGQYLAAQLFRYSGMDREPLCPLRIYTAADVAQVRHLIGG